MKSKTAETLPFGGALSRRRSGAAWAVAVVTSLLFASASAPAITIAPPDSRIPLTLLLERQAQALEQEPTSFWIHRGLARTHGLAAAWKLTGTDSIRAGGFYGQVLPQLWCDPCAHVDYRRRAPSADDMGKEPREDWLRLGSAGERRISYHRDRALHHYRRALELGTKLEGVPQKPRSRRAAISGLDIDQTELGLAWNLLQTGRAEDREEAKSRLVAVIARQEESRRRGPDSFGEYDRDNNVMGPLLSEAIDYLLPLLEESEAAERERLEAVHAKLGHSASAVTPLAIDLRSSPHDELVHGSVDFDLDGTGRRSWSWPSDGVAWLVWDPKLGGVIDDGSRLFGSRSFHLVHSDGFAALCMLDANADGWLRGVELEGLALWQDGAQGVREADGRADAREMISLEAAGVVGLQCARDVVTQRTGHLVIPGGVERRVEAELTRLDLWDLILVSDQEPSSEELCPSRAARERSATSPES